ncbi:MAG: winged helix-turn-helix transcriptional regulator [Oligosphaeraceae bacterium]|nr:winged helix-turn-helix transcriptional regulator [Oligosphaeraceae bacterium]
MIKQKHQQLFDLLRKELRDGTWPEGSKLPSLKELSEQYSVSINVASKAVELLTDARLVTIKKGSGIYSASSGRPAIVEFKYSGERLYGCYRCAKRLHVLLEDYLDWQLEFWNPFFERVSMENPDIELSVSYHRRDVSKSDSFDLVFGSPSFLYRKGFTPEDLFDSFSLKKYGDLSLSDFLLSPEAIPLGNNAYLPYGFLYYRLLTADSAFSEPLHGENVLDYIERHAAGADQPVGYAIENCERFLQNCGLSFLSAEESVFRMPDRELLLTVFSRARTLYQAGHLIFPHGRVSDYDEIYKMRRPQPIRITEYGSNRGNEPDEVLLQRGLRLLKYPAGKNHHQIAMTCAIHRDTLFPEECCRVFLCLLQKKSQQEMRKKRVAESILPGGARNPLQLQAMVISSPLPAYFDEMINYIVNWEFFYYLEGRRNENVYTLIKNKAEHFLKQKQKGQGVEPC